MKTMESRLQSNEIHIPKPEFDLTSNAAPCQYFKSSFARSLSFNTNKTKSLEFGINFGLSQRNGEQTSIAEETTIPSPPTFSSMIYDNCSTHLLNDNNAGTVTQKTTNRPAVAPVTTKLLSNATKNNIWTSFNGTTKSSSSSAATQQEQNKRKSLESTEIEVLRLRKECQNLVEENRRLIDVHSGVGNGTNGVETIVLQTQVDTLQWQLKQVESSRQMYRAVMEEVVRFLERCHRCLDAIQTEPISRSKSVHHVEKVDEEDSDLPNTLRARSSTNLIDFPSSNTCPRQDPMICSSPAGSYNTFRDFTWRRSPKQVKQSQKTQEHDPEKLSQDAFRLYRTAQNLLKTQEPMLSQTKINIENHTMPEGFTSLCKSDMPFNRRLNLRNSRSSLRSSTDDSVHSNSSTKSETDEEIRERTSPSLSMIPRVNVVDRFKEGGHHNNSHHHQHHHNNLLHPLGSSADDESGFSSMNSFQEIGLPLSSSTMISSGNSSSVSSTTSSLASSSVSTNSEESTEVGIRTTIENKTILLPKAEPTTTTPPMSFGGNHRRWDSAPVIPPKKPIHSFTTFSNGDEALKVLWV